MTISLRDKIKQLPIEQQKEIAERATVLIEEETKRQYIRELFRITQESKKQTETQLKSDRLVGLYHPTGQ
jgi:adenylate kinase